MEQEEEAEHMSSQTVFFAAQHLDVEIDMSYFNPGQSCGDLTILYLQLGDCYCNLKSLYEMCFWSCLIKTRHFFLPALPSLLPLIRQRF